MSSPAHVVKIEAAGGAERALIGGKAWSLQSLLDMGAAVPPACVLTTQAYRDWTRHREPQWLRDRLAEAVGMLESTTGRQFGAGPQGLIVSVRSGAPVSMPGMMDTVLNVGLGRLPPGTEAYLYDARVRFLWQFAELVLDLGQPVLEGLRGRFAGLGAPAMAGPLEQALQALAEEQGKSWPASAMDELLAAAGAVFASWQSSRAKLYRRMRKIDDSIGTAVTIQQMVFGNRDAQSGSGVVFTRNPTSGADGLCGEFLFGGQGEEIVSGRETAGSIAQWRERQPEPFRELAALGKRLEEATGKVHEIEFTLEQGRLYVLQCRPALLTGRAAARVAVDFHDEGRISRAEAVVYARSHGFDPTASGRGLVVRPGERPIAMGLPVGGGVAVGRV
ncbi:MAG TPA: PEP/pyruvate-binding domain-containing protein, partial [Steroidobacteraceae bacterium]|nr:PEP/pyruvate-binding domain-containing protein [Steroidobacteraceae bacterium]